MRTQTACECKANMDAQTLASACLCDQRPDAALMGSTVQQHQRLAQSKPGPALSFITTYLGEDADSNVSYERVDTTVDDQDAALVA